MFFSLFQLLPYVLCKETNTNLLHQTIIYGMSYNRHGQDERTENLWRHQHTMAFPGRKVQYNVDRLNLQNIIPPVFMKKSMLVVIISPTVLLVEHYSRDSVLDLNFSLNNFLIQHLHILFQASHMFKPSCLLYSLSHQCLLCYITCLIPFLGFCYSLIKYDRTMAAKRG